eukprot:CAMPEP_0183335100 /NCGR_PEP_ID=MMETSP0164_2-20130417/3499_1 /TAXON_ID=221442 /ORGANISM="Coccolithus pelagicus ssp braarudi, Strain PLY182g" /LENGTH=104 /DNA_ID=CAMNT_0025504381 /DNA_START=19 /DNA_END=333 /DNA_ORIENTATION=-
MGVRHIVLLKFKEGIDKPAVIAEMKKQLGELPEKISQIEKFTFGEDIGLAEGNHDFVLTADFVNEDGYKVYATHEAHSAVIKNAIKPYLAPGGRSAVQFTTSSL